MKNTSVNAQKDAEFVSVLQSTISTPREKQKAFEALYSKHQASIEFYFMSRLRDRNVAEKAEDLKMITFEKVHKNIDLYDSKISVFSTWMYSIAKNALIDHKRKENFEVLSLDALQEKTSDENYGMEFQIFSDSLTPEQEMIRMQNIKAVRDAINSLKSDSVRRLMTYRFIDELSFEEIAKLEGIEENSTLRVNIMRGKEILGDILSSVA